MSGCVTAPMVQFSLGHRHGGPLDGPCGSSSRRTVGGSISRHPSELISSDVNRTSPLGDAVNCEGGSRFEALENDDFSSPFPNIVDGTADLLKLYSVSDFSNTTLSTYCFEQEEAEEQEAFAKLYMERMGRMKKQRSSGSSIRSGGDADQAAAPATKGCGGLAMFKPMSSHTTRAADTTGAAASLVMAPQPFADPSCSISILPMFALPIASSAMHHCDINQEVPKLSRRQPRSSAVPGVEVISRNTTLQQSSGLMGLSTGNNSCTFGLDDASTSSVW